MFIIRQHTHEIVQYSDGYSVVCDGIALWRGLSFEAAETIFKQLTRGK